MPATFSASTCINSSVTSPGPFNIYLDSDYTSTPFSSATLNELTNCPYIIVVPTGTTSLGFKDTILDFCFETTIQNNNICSNCNLGLSNYSASTISKLYCGVLTGSCQFSDYLISWYGPNSTTTLSFQSGAGSFLTPGVYSHPFSTEPTSIPRESGVYTPVITKIKLSGLTFSNTGGTNTVLFDGNCLSTTNILPLTCTVVTNPDTSNYVLSAYTNYLSFDSNTGGVPQAVSATYQISASTKYIVWNFIGDNFVDRIKLEFSGSSYGTNKIGLEDFFVGGNLPSSDFSASTYPKSADTASSFIKYTCLTGLTVNNNDNIIISITPAISKTNWYLYMSCLDSYNCNDCLNTQNYKIVGSTITGTTTSCNENIIKFKISGCSYPDSSSDYIDYYLGSQSIVSSNVYSCVFPSSLSNSQTTNLYFASESCNQSATSLSFDCSNPSLPNVTCCQEDSVPAKYRKTFLIDGSGRGVYGFTGSSTFISTYYNSIRNSFLGLPPYNSTWSGSSNSNNQTYYRWYRLRLPGQTTTSSCGDGSTFLDTYIHHTSPYITGTTISGVTTLYYLHLTANTISSTVPFTSCQLNCNSNISSVVNQINVYSTGATSFTGVELDFSQGIYYSNPISYCQYFTSGSTTQNFQEFNGYFVTPDWSFNTYPFSGNPSTIIPSLSGSVCNYNSTGRYIGPSFNSFYRQQYKYAYKIQLTNPLNAGDFDIYASPINNFTYSGSPGTAFYDLAYRYSGGNVTFSSSTYIIG
jgi:hypothetical protein